MTSSSEAAGGPLGGAFALQRERIRSFVTAQRQRFQRIEAELASRVEQCQRELAQRQEELAAGQAALEAARHELHERELAVEHQRGQQQSERAVLEALRETLTRRSADLDARQEQLESLRARTEEQRRRVGRQLRAQRQAQSKGHLRPASSGRTAPAAVKPAGQGRAPESDGKLSWEVQKRRILEALESEEASPEAASRRTEIEEVVRATESALSEKDRELDEMRRVLDSQAQSLGDVAVGATALSEIFDQDALIREGRENLRRLQQEWEEKLRQAEIDISLERAKVARERNELEEKLRRYEEHRQHADANSGASADRKPPRGRWLARLGLKEDDPPQ